MLTGKLWARYLHKHESQLRPVIIESVSQVLACGRFIMGYATWQCSNQQCSHERRICFGCKSRFCNTCGKKATDQWIEQQKVVLPDIQWQHITFTMPSELWPLFKANRQLLGKLSALAAKTLQTMARKKGITPGIFTAIHTFGRGLNWNVHIHLSVTRGGLFDNNTHWKSHYFAKDPIMKQWRYVKS